MKPRRAFLSRPPAGRLITLVDRDLPGHTMRSTGPGRAVFEPAGHGVALEVTERVERQFLGRTTTAVFVARWPAPPGDDLALEVRHTGRLRRTGVDVNVRAGDHAARSVAGRLLAGEAFVHAARDLDFRRFELTCTGAVWSATIELVGATMVAMALPPARQYVRLHADQRKALLRCLTLARDAIADVGSADARFSGNGG